MEPVTIIIPGTPLGKGRHRTVVVGGQPRHHSDPKTAKYETAIKWLAKDAMRRADPFDAAVTAVVLAEYPIPASWPQKKRDAAIRGEIRPTVKPDADNCAKAILDAMNGIVFRDDALVTDLIVRKRYGVDPKVVVTIQDARAK